MLHFLRRLWSRDHKRRIFTYWDGSAWQRADPLVLGRQLEESCPDYVDQLTTLTHEPPITIEAGPVLDDLNRKKAAALTALVSGTRAAFGIQPLGARLGLTEAETVHLLAAYLAFMGGLADLARPFVISPPPASASTPPDSPTPSSAASGTVGAESQMPGLPD